MLLVGVFASESIVLCRALFFPPQMQICSRSAWKWGAQGDDPWLGLGHNTITDTPTSTLSALVLDRGAIQQAPHLVKDVSAHSQKLDQMIIKGPSQPKPFHDSK